MSHESNQKKMDWHLFCTAAGVVVSLGSIIFGCYNSLSNKLYTMQNDIAKIQTDVVKIETIMIIKGIMPKELAVNIEKN